MSYIPTPEQALELVRKYNKDEFHIQHAKIVGGILRHIASEVCPNEADFWHAVGILHDIDFELFPDQHCIKTPELLAEENIDERIIRAAVSHGYMITVDVEPTHIMEKYLYTIDELSGLIGAAAILRPSKSVSDIEVKSVKKKYKSLNFAKGCNREVIERGCEMLGITVDDAIALTITAMRTLVDELGI